LEVLEGRDVPAIVSWINASGGDWDTASNWSTGQLPGASDDVVLNVPGTVTITHSTNTADAVRSISGTNALALSSGSLSVSSNSVYGGAVTLSGATLTGGGNLELDGALTWNAGTMSGTGTTLAKGTVLLNPTTQFFQPGLTLDGRTFENAKAATWVGGNISTGNGAVFDNMAGATLTIQTDSTFDSNFGQQATFQNEGTVTKSLTIGTTTFNTLFDNTGAVTVKTGTLNLNGGGDATGTFKAVSGATLGFTQDHYTLEAASLVSGGGTVQFLDNAFFGGSVYSVNGSFTASKVLISGGTVNFDANTTLPTLTFTGGTVSGTGNLTVTGPLNWTGGTMSGSGTTTANGALLIETTSATPVLNGRTFESDGTATLTGSGTFTIVSGALFDNPKGSTFNVQGDATIGDGSDTGTFSNEGTFRKTLTTGTTPLDVQFNNTGTTSVQSGTLALAGGGTSSGSFAASSGADLTFSGGTNTLSSTSRVTGAGAVTFQGGTTNILGVFSATSDLSVTGGTASFFQNLTLPTLTMSGGTFYDAGNVTIKGLLTWYGGSLTGPGVTLAKGGVTLENMAGFFQTGPTLDGRTFENAGTLTWLGGNVSTGNGAIFDNLAGATFAIETDATFDSNFGQQSTFQNAGAVTKSVTTGVTHFNPLFDNTGSVDVLAGTVALNGGGSSTGTFTAESGAILDFSAGTTTLAPTSAVGGAGTVQFGAQGFFGGSGGTTNLEGTFTAANTDIIGGTVNVTSNLSLANLTMSGGTLTGPSTITVAGPLDWTGGTMSGSGTTIAAGGLTIDTTTGGNPGLDARTFQNTLVGTLIGNGGTFAVSNTGTFDNAAGGALTIQGSVSFGAAFFQGPGAVRNEGTLTLSGTGTAVTVNETFSTSGTIDLGGDALSTSGTYTQTAGTTNLQGGTLTAGGTGVVLQAAASLIGPGTVNANVSNAGLVDPGSAGAPGQLTINGSYTQSGTGTLEIQLGGTTPGSGGYDQLDVNGAVTLDGTLSVALVNGFVPQSGQQFPFLTDSSESGTFATDLFPAGVNFQVAYGPNGVTLTAI